MDLLGDDDAAADRAPDAFGVFAISAAGRDRPRSAARRVVARLLDMKKARSATVPLPDDVARSR